VRKFKQHRRHEIDGTVAKMNTAARAPVSDGSFRIPKVLAVTVDRQQQADNDGDYHGLIRICSGEKPNS
jgi:hypothetical protein